MNKQDKNGIEWTDWTWNPVTGCQNTCWYCYVKRLAKRFGYDRRSIFHADRLLDPAKKAKVGDKIFVCSTADLFGIWVPEGWIGRVLQVTNEAINKPAIFQFLTKNPSRMRNYLFQNNHWVGTTVEHKNVTHRISDISEVNAPAVRFISFEPLLSEMPEMDLLFIDWIIIGAMTGPGSKEHQPKREWVENIIKQARANNVPVFLKDNLHWPKKIQEFPISFAVSGQLPGIEFFWSLRNRRE